MMKAIVNTRSGSLDALRIMEVEKPALKPNQVLIKTKASAITNMEYMRYTNFIKNGKPGVFASLIDTALCAKGKALGTELSGIIEEVGKNATRFKVGDAVFGLSLGMKGAWAEFSVANEKEICKKPDNLSFEQAAAIPVGAITALGAITTAKVQQGQQVLIQGGSGGVGQYAVQLAKARGGIVTAVCSSRNTEAVKALGADYIINYDKENISEAGKVFDVIIAINGYNSLSTYKRILNDSGCYVFVGGTPKAIASVIGIPFYSIGNKKFKTSAYPMLPKKKCLSDLKDLAEQGKIKPCIDNVYTPCDISGALLYIVKEHSKGKVVVNMDFRDC